jgi:hypothetical protein
MGDLTSPGATARRSIALDPATNEILFDQKGRVTWLSGAAAIAQALRLAFQLWRGEWFLDELVGAEWSAVLGQKFNEAKAVAFATTTSLSVAGVSRVTGMEVTYDGTARELTIVWAVETDYGPLFETTVLAIPEGAVQ